MKKIKRHILTGFLVFALILTSVSVAFASDDVDLNLYRNRLEEINAELGTSYKIPDKEEIKVTNMTYEELQQFYGEMSLEEFDQYIYQLDSENDRTKVMYGSVGSQIQILVLLLPQQILHNIITIHHQIVIIWRYLLKLYSQEA